LWLLRLCFFQEQKFLVGVVLMVPIYAIESVRCHNLSCCQRAITMLAEVDSAVNLHALFYQCSIYRWSIHRSVLILRFCGMATRHLPCTVSAGT
jgi:hypothetical protein